MNNSLQSLKNKTDWDSYYLKPYKSASYSRKITGKILTHLIGKIIKDTPHLKSGSLKIAELGGGNSAFYSLINKEFKPSKYYILDNNQTGLKKFAERIGSPKHVALIEADVLSPLSKKERQEEPFDFDLVYSIGLIEHFDFKGTRAAIQYHIDLIPKGSSIIITYPTPTFLYKFIRKIAEILGLWIFHDERPLSLQEVESHIHSINSLIFKKGERIDIKKHFINWPILLTQAIIVLEKKEI